MLRIFLRHKRGQSMLEYTVVFIVLVGAFVASQIMIRRGVLGRWRAAMDDHGDQYDPHDANTLVRQTLAIDSQTQVLLMNAAFTDGGYITRYDQGTTVESKQGYEGPATPY